MSKEKIIYGHLSYKVVGLAMEVHRKLGYGFLEKVYENSLMVLLRREGIEARQQLGSGSILKAKLLVTTSPIFWSPANSCSR